MEISQLEAPDRTTPLATDACVMLDARYLNGKSSGIGRYTRHLIDHLLQLDSRLRLKLITHPACPRPVDSPRVESQTFFAPANSLSTRYVLTKSIDFSDVDLFHSPFNILPADLPVPAVFTLHDIMWLLDPTLCTSKLWKRLVTGTFYRTFIPQSVRQAAAILTVSDYSQQEISDYFPDAEKRVDVAYNGLDPYFRPVSPQKGWPLLSKWMVPGTRFVLVVGQGAPYKNHAAALRGFIEAFADDPEVYCVFVRRLHKSGDGELRKLLADRRLNSRVIHLDYIGGDELRALYTLAEVFLFPSLYEGFGLPALEAMACETAVVTSDRGAPKEICNGGAVLVDPTDPAAIGAALKRLFADDALRLRVAEAGRSRAHHFRWADSARQALTTYRRILQTPPPRSS